MIGARRMAAIAALLALPPLSGCVAAAIPVLAAGGVLGTQVGGDGNRAPAGGPPRVSVDLSEAAVPASGEGAAGQGTSRAVTLADGTRMEVMTGPRPAANTPAPAALAPAASVQAPPTSAAGSPSGGRTFTLDDGTTVRVVAAQGGMPPPSAGQSAGVATYDAMRAYAARQGGTAVIGQERRSAMLASPGTLQPATRDCSIHPAAVFIDLDPGAALLDPSDPLRADPGLVQALASLRAQGIAIAWLSGNTADMAGAIRNRLVSSGLDPAGRDELALLRYPDERKQTRREDFAQQFCVVAIAGDDRSDFDELFLYLKNPALAAPLEPLIGKGWFLIPQPLS